LLFASDRQINAIIPFGMPVNARQTLVVQKGSSITVPEPVTLAAAQPAIFTRNQGGTGQGIVVSPSGQFYDPGNPARPGDVIVIYCAGLGEVSPPVPAGAAAPATPLSLVTAKVSLVIGGREARVLFAGLAPGYAGLYQVNAIVPEDAPPGDAVPVVLTVADQASPTVTMAVGAP